MRSPLHFCTPSHILWPHRVLHRRPQWQGVVCGPPPSLLRTPHTCCGPIGGSTAGPSGKVRMRFPSFIEYGWVLRQAIFWGVGGGGGLILYFSRRRPTRSRTTKSTPEPPTDGRRETRRPAPSAVVATSNTITFTTTINIATTVTPAIAISVTITTTLALAITMTLKHTQKAIKNATVCVGRRWRSCEVRKWRVPRTRHWQAT